MKVPGARTRRAAQCVTLVADRGDSSVGDCQVKIRKTYPWTIVGNMIGESHAPCTLTPVVDFGVE